MSDACENFTSGDVIPVIQELADMKNFQKDNPRNEHAVSYRTTGHQVINLYREGRRVRTRMGLIIRSA
jgi:hypothetical protein